MHIWVEPSVIDAIAALPGNMRQRIRRAIRELPQDPRPPQSRRLNVPQDIALEQVEARRRVTLSQGQRPRCAAAKGRSFDRTPGTARGILR